MPTELERNGDFSQSVDGSGNPYPYIRDYTTGLPCSASNTCGCFRDGGVLGQIPENRHVRTHASHALSLYPTPERHRGRAATTTRARRPTNQPRREELIRVDYQASDRWRLAGRYMQHSDNQDLPYGTGPVGSNNLDTVDTTFDMPGRNWMVSATGVLNNATSLELSGGSAHNSIDIYTTNPNLTRSAAGHLGAPDALPERRPGRHTSRPSCTAVGGSASPAYFNLGNAPFTNVNTTYDVIANLTRMLGSHALKVGVYFQKSLKDQAAFAQLQRQHLLQQRRQQPVRHEPPVRERGPRDLPAVQAGFDVRATAKWRYTNLEWYAQDNWKASAQADARLRRALLLSHAAVGRHRSRPPTSCRTGSTPPAERRYTPPSALVPIPVRAPTAAV